MKSLIVGAGGFIGAHSARALADAGWEIHAKLRTPSSSWRLNELGVNVARVGDFDTIDLRDFDVIMVAAGFATPRGLDQQSLGTLGAELDMHRTLLQAILDQKADPLVLVSGSRTQYGAVDQLPVAEDHHRHPNSVYALEKDMVERLYALAFEQAGVRSVSLRITNPYGPLEWDDKRSHGLVSAFIGQAVTKGYITVFGTGELLRDYIAVADLAQLVVAISQTQLQGYTVVNVGSGIGTSIVDMATHVAHQIQLFLPDARDCSVQFVPTPEGVTQVETGGFVSDISRARRLFNWQPTQSLVDYLAQTIPIDAQRMIAALDN